jgi:hypothetical protein
MVPINAALSAEDALPIGTPLNLPAVASRKIAGGGLKQDHQAVGRVDSSFLTRNRYASPIALKEDCHEFRSSLAHSRPPGIPIITVTRRRTRQRRGVAWQLRLRTPMGCATTRRYSGAEGPMLDKGPFRASM